MEVRNDDLMAALYGEALDFAQTLDEDLSSFHFLLSFFTTPSEVTVLFEDLGLDERTVTAAYREIKRRGAREGGALIEPEGTIPAIEKRAGSFVQCQSGEIAPLHLLLAILSEKRSIAYQILEETGRLGELRLRAMNVLTNPPRRIRNRILELLQEAVLVRSSGAVAAGHDDATAVVGEKEKSSAPSSPTIPPSVASEEEDLPEIFRQFGRNLTALARAAVLDPVSARDREITLLIDILGRKKSNNPLLVGAAGVGKTAIVEGLACRQGEGLLSGKIIWELNLSALVAGTEYRGVLEQRMAALIAEVERLKNRLIVFIDEIHLLGSETHEMVANILKPSLARGEFPLIGATTPEEFKRFIARDPAMERRFTIVKVEEPAGEALQSIALSAARSLSAYHHVRLDDARFVTAAIDLSNRYLSGRSQPDKVLTLLDTLGSVLQRLGKRDAEIRDLLELVSARSGIPIENLLLDGTHILRTLPERLESAVKGQTAAKERIARLLARRFVRKEPHRPIAAMVFAGPTGVGKTETARALAAYFFGSERRMVSFDMSDFREPHTVARLVGAPPGYTGYEEGGLLTEAFRREPYQLLLIEEADKAHPHVLSVLSHLVSEGSVADSRGFSVSFANAIVIMTCGAGTGDPVARLGFGNDVSSQHSSSETMRAKVEKTLSPEIVSRVDEVVVFTPFSEDEWHAVAEHLIMRTVASICENYGVSVSVDDPSLIASVLMRSLGPADRQQGARAVQRWVGAHIESPVLDAVARAEPGVALRIAFEAATGKVQCRFLPVDG